MNANTTWFNPDSPEGQRQMVRNMGLRLNTVDLDELESIIPDPYHIIGFGPVEVKVVNEKNGKSVSIFVERDKNGKLILVDKDSTSGVSEKDEEIVPEDEEDEDDEEVEEEVPEGEETPGGENDFSEEDKDEEEVPEEDEEEVPEEDEEEVPEEEDEEEEEEEEPRLAECGKGKKVRRLRKYEDEDEDEK